MFGAFLPVLVGAAHRERAGSRNGQATTFRRSRGRLCRYFYFASSTSVLVLEKSDEPPTENIEGENL
jgi:hypothetical protein